MRHRSWCVLTVAAAVGLAGCAIQSTSADPFAAAGDRPARFGRLHRVTLEAVCAQECAITYSFGARIESLRWSSPIWRRRFDRFPVTPEAIRLTVSGQVERVRIYVGGDLVASAEQGPADFNGILTAEAVIPSDASPPAPDTLNVEGARPSSRP